MHVWHATSVDISLILNILSHKKLAARLVEGAPVRNFARRAGAIQFAPRMRPHHTLRRKGRAATCERCAHSELGTGTLGGDFGEIRLENANPHRGVR
jgi:hypothetical protein